MLQEDIPASNPFLLEKMLRQPLLSNGEKKLASLPRILSSSHHFQKRS